jgi:hypothetical protein
VDEHEQVIASLRDRITVLEQAADQHHDYDVEMRERNG